ncbi:hypothetical protein [Bradyrhizobium lablabi]|uniref:hypothetical protein n=1 Tax=Bradyrhizobium lablabi TaxID=722472 RepID=UPI0020136643|nr:hypothetical protein [Bradyrhizobium lablabi]
MSLVGRVLLGFVLLEFVRALFGGGGGGEAAKGYRESNRDRSRHGVSFIPATEILEIVSLKQTISIG